MGRLGGGGAASSRRSGSNAGGGGVLLNATGAPRPANWKCQKETNKAADAKAEVRSVLRHLQRRMGLPG